MITNHSKNEAKKICLGMAREVKSQLLIRCWFVLPLFTAMTIIALVKLLHTTSPLNEQIEEGRTEYYSQRTETMEHRALIDDDVDPYFSSRVQATRAANVIRNRAKRCLQTNKMPSIRVYNGTTKVKHSLIAMIYDRFLLVKLNNNDDLRIGLHYIYKSLKNKLGPQISLNSHFNQSYFTHIPKELRDFSQYDAIQTPSSITVDITDSYFEHPWIPRRIESIIPNPKFIILLRNPVMRAISHILELKGDSFSSDIVMQLIQEDIELIKKSRQYEAEYEESFHFGFFYPELAGYDNQEFYSHWDSQRRDMVVSGGLYADNIRRWLRYFPRESFLFIDSQQLFHDTENQFNRITSHIGLQKSDGIGAAIFTRTESKAVNFVTTNCFKHKDWIKALATFYQRDYAKLRALIGDDFGWSQTNTWENNCT